MNGFHAACLAVVLALLPGCSWAWKSSRMTELENQNLELKGRLEESDQSRRDLLSRLDRLQGELVRAQEDRAGEVERLMRERDEAVRVAAAEKERQSQEFVEAERQLAESLKKELSEARAKLALTERGLVLTFLDEIFFDSGKAVIKPEGLETLGKVAKVLRETVPDSSVAVEGHTDNEPIRYSAWRSNWELASGRALAVLHYFTDQQGLAAERVRAVVFGEYQPVASNETPEGRRQNRRVEIVILPQRQLKVKEEELKR